MCDVAQWDMEDNREEITALQNIFAGIFAIGVICLTGARNGFTITVGFSMMVIGAIGIAISERRLNERDKPEQELEQAIKRTLEEQEGRGIRL